MKHLYCAECAEYRLKKSVPSSCLKLLLLSPGLGDGQTRFSMGDAWTARVTSR